MITWKHRQIIVINQDPYYEPNNPLTHARNRIRIEEGRRRLALLQELCTVLMIGENNIKQTKGENHE